MMKQYINALLSSPVPLAPISPRSIEKCQVKDGPTTTPTQGRSFWELSNGHREMEGVPLSRGDPAWDAINTAPTNSAQPTGRDQQKVGSLSLIDISTEDRVSRA
jgi:hypothetical protein